MTTAFLLTVQVIQWPSMSDLNPIEHMWDILKRKVEKHHVSNIQQLCDVIMEEWKRMPATTYAALVNFMLRRIKAVLDNNGACYVPYCSGRDVYLFFLSLSSYSHLTGPVIGPCFRQSSILHDALRTNQTLVGAYKDPDVMRVREERLLFICLPSLSLSLIHFICT